MERLKQIKKSIENMSKYHQIEILRICKSDNTILINENNNGSFINLTEQNDNFIDKLDNYIKYVLEQKEEFEIIENEKERIQKNFFYNDNKIITNINKEIKDSNKEIYNEL